MTRVNEYTEHALREVFGPRVQTGHVDRMIYSHDPVVLPRLARWTLPTGTAGAVVRPADEDEIRALVRVAIERGIALVARGAGTSIYGGVLPARGGVVVDMSGMDRVLRVDRETMTVCVQAGTVWESLREVLASDGLDVRVYPSSSPASTVAGWLAQGGCGIGSYEYGCFKDNVVSARVVLPDSTVVTCEGDELLRFVADVGGVTGIITTVLGSGAGSVAYDPNLTALQVAPTRLIAVAIDAQGEHLRAGDGRYPSAVRAARRHVRRRNASGYRGQ